MAELPKFPRHIGNRDQGTRLWLSYGTDTVFHRTCF